MEIPPGLLSVPPVLLSLGVYFSASSLAQFYFYVPDTLDIV